MELRELVRLIRRRWIVIVAVATFSVIASGLLTLVVAPQYQSVARLFVSTQSSDTAADLNQGGLFSAQRVTSYADLVASRDLAARVIDDLGLAVEADELSSDVNGTAVSDTVIIEIAYRHAEPSKAQAITQSYSENLVDLVRELETPPGRSEAPIKATIVDAASMPASPVSPRPARNLALGLLAGLVIGLGIAAVRELLDTTVKSPDDLEERLSAPVLGTIAYDSETKQRPLITTLDSHAPRVEAVRVLRTNLQFVEVDSRHKVFVVTSALPEEGKTTTSLNLALAMAQAGHRTLLIEGDLRRPKASAALNLDNSVGITTVLVGRMSLEDALQTYEPTGLDVLASGAVPPNPAELLQSNSMSRLLEAVRARYEVVIIDAPPLLPVTDAALLASQADGALLVVRYGKTTRDQVDQAVQRLRQVDGRAVGVVLNMVPSKAEGSYGYGYGYAPTATPESR